MCGIDKVKARIEDIRSEIQRLAREDKRNQAFGEMVRKKTYERQRFNMALKAGRILDSIGILDNYDEEKLRTLLTDHKDEIIRRQD